MVNPLSPDLATPRYPTVIQQLVIRYSRLIRCNDGEPNGNDGLIRGNDGRRNDRALIR